MKFLVVDDPAMTRRIIVDALNQLGFADTIEARDGQEGLIRSQESIGFLITALRMPRMGGIELVRAARSRVATARVPVLVITDEGEPLELTAQLAAGPLAVLAHPFAIHELRNKIVCLLGGQVNARKASRRAAAELLFDSEASLRLVDQALVDLRILADVRADPVFEGVPARTDASSGLDGWASLLGRAGRGSAAS